MNQCRVMGCKRTAEFHTLLQNYGETLPYPAKLCGHHVETTDGASYVVLSSNQI